MRLSHLTRRTTLHLRSTLALAAVALLAVACSDSSLSPSQARAAAGGQPQLSMNDGAGNFTYDPTQDVTVRLGSNDHSIVIPAGSVCAIGKTKYGPGTWDLPCKPEDKKQNITFKTFTDVNGHPYIEFQPALRFVPDQVVVLYLADKKASMDDYSEILYCPDNKAIACYNESLTDASLKTVRDQKGKIFRRIKHFSGYNVAAGLEDDLRGLDLSRGLTSGVTLRNAPAAAADGRKRSGYMVVSGLEDGKLQQ